MPFSHAKSQTMNLPRLCSCVQQTSYSASILTPPVERSTPQSHLGCRTRPNGRAADGGGLIWIAEAGPRGLIRPLNRMPRRSSARKLLRIGCHNSIAVITIDYAIPDLFALSDRTDGRKDFHLFIDGLTHLVVVLDQEYVGGTEK
jgi:hypothetical protein